MEVPRPSASSNFASVPRLGRDDGPADFAIQLRLHVFPSQRAAARHFRREPGTISRYESERIVPPLGYLASLMELILDAVPAQAPGTAGRPAVEQGFVEDLRKLVQRFPDAYDRVTPIRSWEQARQVAARYRSQREPGETARATDDPGIEAPTGGEAGSLAAEAARPAGEIPWPAGIPQDIYYPLPGREGDLQALQTVLGDPAGAPVVAIDGLGGLGKTALAVELARRMLAAGHFIAAIGDSAKQEVLADSTLISLREAALDFDGLCDTLIHQLRRWELLTRGRAERQAALTALLRQRPYLLLVDNLETAENAGALVLRLRGLLTPSRALLTSRPRVPHGFVHTLSLTGLAVADSLLFLRTEAARREVPRLGALPDAALRELHTLTGGAPLALRLVVAQARFLDVPVIGRELAAAHGDLYPYLFRRSWEQLSTAAQRILIYLGHTAISSVSWEELADETLAERDLVAAVGELVAASLVDPSQRSGELRYSIHPLTRHFINSTLPQLWQGDDPQ